MIGDPHCGLGFWGGSPGSSVEQVADPCVVQVVNPHQRCRHGTPPFTRIDFWTVRSRKGVERRDARGTQVSC